MVAGVAPLAQATTWPQSPVTTLRHADFAGHTRQAEETAQRAERWGVNAAMPARYAATPKSEAKVMHAGFAGHTASTGHTMLPKQPVQREERVYRAKHIEHGP